MQGNTVGLHGWLGGRGVGGEQVFFLLLPLYVLLV